MSVEERMVRRDAPYDLCDVTVRGAPDPDLTALSEALGLGLSLDEMRAVREIGRAHV